MEIILDEILYNQVLHELDNISLTVDNKQVKRKLSNIKQILRENTTEKDGYNG